MRECISREAALAALRKYNKELFHIQHAFTVEGVMRWYANDLGYGEEADFWATVGLLHDIDFEQWPQQHCVKAPELLREAGCGEDLIHAVCSHGYGLCCDVEPTEEMEKVLFCRRRADGPHRSRRPHAPQPQRAGHGAQEPEEEVQGPQVCRRLLPGCHHHRGGAAGLGAGCPAGEDPGRHALLRGADRRGNGEAVRKEARVAYQTV